jgi:hypothetical protein
MLRRLPEISAEFVGAALIAVLAWVIPMTWQVRSTLLLLAFCLIADLIRRTQWHRYTKIAAWILATMLLATMVLPTIYRELGENNSDGTPVAQAPVPPPITPQDFGALSPKVLLEGSRGGIPMLQIGPNGTTFMWLGQGTKPTFFNFFDRNRLIVGETEGQVTVSTQIRDRTGQLVAELADNEWKVAAPPLRWDRNYSRDALEVRGPDGNVVLQVKLLPDKIQIQGEWWDRGGKGVRLVTTDDGRSFVLMLSQDNYPAEPGIKPMFRYPSDNHLGELAPSGP